MNLGAIWKSLILIASFVSLMAGPALPQNGGAAGKDKPITIVAFGDSLMAGYELPPGADFPTQLEKALRGKGHNVKLVNVSVSGDTAADGLARFDWAMPEDADAVILELGANDTLRGIPIAETKNALSQILDKLKARKLPVLLAGMIAPTNWGKKYRSDFGTMYANLADEYGAVFYPFFLDGVVPYADLTLDDGLHPNEKGIDVLVERLLPVTEKLIERVKAQGKTSG